MKIREFDLVVYGATGFTGRLVAEHLAARASANPALRWALGGRNPEKLAAVRDALGLPADFPLVTADAADPAQLEGMTERTRACLTTAGPYQLYGSGLVAACAKTGTDYLDLAGETVWMRRMIDAHAATAEASGARVLFSCGIDSLPFEAGVMLVQEAALAASEAPVPHVRGRVVRFDGAYSGGTIASMRAGMAAAAADPAVAALAQDPFALTPGFRGPEQPPGNAPAYDAELGAWVAPFVMAAINTRNVHRSNFLRHQRYGRDFVYDEMLVTGPGPKGEATAKAIAEGLRRLGGGDDAPPPGEGPTLAEREAGSYELHFHGTTVDGARLRSIVTGDRDPGYGSTSKVIAETALCLLERDTDLAGGIWTPVAALGTTLLDRLAANAGLTFRTAAA